MKKTAVVAILMIVVLLVSATAGFAWSRGGGGGGVRQGGWSGNGGWHGHGGFHGHGVVVVGPGCCWGPWWGWGWGWPGPYPYYAQPQVIVQPAPVIIDSSTQGSMAPPESFWYYCPSTKAYYPNVSGCNEAWIKVPPRSE